MRHCGVAPSASEVTTVWRYRNSIIIIIIIRFTVCRRLYCPDSWICSRLFSVRGFAGYMVVVRIGVTVRVSVSVSRVRVREGERKIVPVVYIYPSRGQKITPSHI